MSIITLLSYYYHSIIIFEQIFLSAQVKRSGITSKKYYIQATSRVAKLVKIYSQLIAFPCSTLL